MRLIDADAFKQMLKQSYTFYGFVDLLNDFYVAIDEQPTIDAVEVEWIPIEREAPKDGQEILVCYDDGTILGTRYNPRSLSTWLAWMPQPKPYKERKESE